MISPEMKDILLKGKMFFYWPWNEQKTVFNSIYTDYVDNVQFL